MPLRGRSILLIISGGIAAYKSLELIRLLRKSGAHVRCILTRGGEQFVTPLSVSALCEEEVFTDLWSLKDESEMGHIRLTREADLIIIAPASANLLAQMAGGLAQDLASTTLLAANKPVFFAPAMNVEMWNDPATTKNLQTLRDHGHTQIGPEKGDMACGEYGLGRMSDPQTILQTLIDHVQGDKPLAGKTALVTSGPTYEEIDPVRFIGNRSSGKQGHAIAQELAQAGAAVTLISGPVAISAPENVQTIHVESANDMLKAAKDAGTCDIAVCAAAVSDWRAKETTDQKIKKSDEPPAIALIENPDILAQIAHGELGKRPSLVIGFAAETQNTHANAKAKLKRKGCDWILANTVANGKIFGQEETDITLITPDIVDEWGIMSKTAVAKTLVKRIIEQLQQQK